MAEAPAPTRAVRLLLVGDGTLDAVAAATASPPFVASRVAGGAEAQRLAALGGVDLIVAALNLPPDGGAAFCQALRADFMLFRTPVVLVLHDGSDAAREAALGAGADDYLASGSSPEEIRARLRLAVDRASRAPLVNPLSGLPGNQVLNREMEKRIAGKRPFAACYVDLDNFKAFNDHYGFEQGDRVILFLARLLTRVIQEHGAPGDFVGHIGGDDFLLLTEPARVESLASKTIAAFDQDIGEFYRAQDLSRGYILTWDRAGNIQESSVMTVSIAVATNSHRAISHLGEVGAILADLKQYVKLLPGSNCVVDRRTDPRGGSPDRRTARDEAWRGLILTERQGDEPPGEEPLPSVTQVMGQVADLVRRAERLGTVCFSVTTLSRTGETPVWTEVPELMDRIGAILRAQKGRAFRREDFIVSSPSHDNAVFLFLAPPREQTAWRLEELEEVAERVRTAVLAELVAQMGRYESQRFQIQSGASLIREKGGPLARLIYQGMDTALRAGVRRGRRDRSQRATTLRRLLDGGQIRALLQPMISLHDGHLLGYEALARGPKGSDLEGPRQLFQVARSADLVWTLDRLCHRIAASRAATFPPDARLFLNCDPELAHDPEFRSLTASDYASLAGRPVVLEIPEEALARRLGLVRSAVATFRAQGFEIAVDHTSTEFRVLGPLDELRPEFVKFEVALVRAIDREPARRELLGAMIRYAGRIGAVTIASGVETEAESAALAELGMGYAQGNLFSPGFDPDEEPSPG